ncbi:MAG: EamA/RhaT family transporter, partial [Nocardioidaceae bacterium]|nr:EamA/RhaT family transporter [Nocardioidaceae bacterium]
AQLLGHSVFNHLLAVMSPAVVSLLLLLEVPAAALLAGLFLGQTPPIGVYVGLVLILVGLAVVLTRTEAVKQATPPYPGD